MIDMEKVIKGLKCKITNEVSCIGCPYLGSGYCIENIAKDALDLLKEQERRINELEEKLRLMEYGDHGTLHRCMMPATEGGEV